MICHRSLAHRLAKAFTGWNAGTNKVSQIIECGPLCQKTAKDECNPSYAYVKTEDGKETTVSTRDLAPMPKGDYDAQNLDDFEIIELVHTIKIEPENCF